MKPETKLGSKSTASLFLLAYRHALQTANWELMDQLLQKLSAVSVNVQMEFSRKLAFRLLGQERPDKLCVLVQSLMQYPICFVVLRQRQLETQEPVVEPIAGVPAIDFKSTLLAVTSLRQVLLVTVDVRNCINQREEYRPLFEWLFAIVHDVMSVYTEFNPDRPEDPADGNAMDVDRQSLTPEQVDTMSSLLEMVSKALCDLFLVVGPKETIRFIEYGVISATAALFKSPFPAVVDHAFRYLSYLYEYSSFKFGGMSDPAAPTIHHPNNEGLAVAMQTLNNSEIFDALLEVLNDFETFVDILLTYLQHFATNMAPRIPKRLRVRFYQAFQGLRTSPDHTIQNHALRCVHVMSSVGIRIGISVLYRENVESRRSKQVWMHRQCEGCQKRETIFGEFMMCAGCRKVRYCSKDCQVRDWKYHRMSCQFFRPRPGFRSRGTSTPVEQSTQTDESSFSPPELPAVGRTKRSGSFSSTQQFDGQSPITAALQQRQQQVSTSQRIPPSDISSQVDVQTVDPSQIADQEPEQEQEPHIHPVNGHRIRSRDSSTSDLMNSSQQSLDMRPRTTETQSSTDTSYSFDIHAWRNAEYRTISVQTSL